MKVLRCIRLLAAAGSRVHTNANDSFRVQSTAGRKELCVSLRTRLGVGMQLGLGIVSAAYKEHNSGMLQQCKEA